MKLRWHYDNDYQAWFTRYKGVTIQCDKGVFSVPSIDTLALNMPYVTCRLGDVLEYIDDWGIILGGLEV